MRKKLFSSLIGVVLCAVMLASSVPFAQGTAVELEVLSPRGAVEMPPLISLAERLNVGTITVNDPYHGEIEVPDLNGKRILIWCYGKDSGGRADYTGAIRSLLTEWYPDIIITGQYNKSDVAFEQGVWSYDMVARGTSAASNTPPGVDAVILGVAN